MTAKRKIWDFVCAFTGFAIVLVSIAMLAGESFFEDAVSWKQNEGVLILFGNSFVLDTSIGEIMSGLLSFYDRLFGRDICRIIQDVAAYITNYIKDGLLICYNVASMLAGAK